jgi:hypothetical protein
VTEASSNT